MDKVEKEKRKLWRKYYVKERRTKAQRRWLYKTLLKSGLHWKHAQVARDWTTGHIERTHGIKIEKVLSDRTKRRQCKKT